MVTLFSTTQGQGHGAEAVLCELLGTWPRSGAPLQVAAPRGSRVLACAADCGFGVVPIGSQRDALVDNGRAVFKALRGRRDLGLVHAWSARGFELAWGLKHWLGVRVSGTLHDHPRARFHGRARRFLMRQGGNRLDRLAVVSAAVGKAVQAEGWQVPVTVIRNGLQDRPRCAVSASPVVRIGFLGMYATWKGTDMVAAWLRQQGVPAGVVWQLYGTPSPEVAAQFDPVMRCGADRVRMMGRRPTHEIFDEIDVLVHASTHFDPLPTVLLEAARAGIPCVASCCGGADEIVVDGETGFLFRPEQPEQGWTAIERLVKDAGLRVGMGAAARQRYTSAFQVAGMVAGYQAFWAQIQQSRDQRD